MLGRLNQPETRRIVAAIEQMASNPFAGDIRALAGEPDAYRRRVGDWRILFTVDLVARAVRIYRVGPRGGVYK